MQKEQLFSCLVLKNEIPFIYRNMKTAHQSLQETRDFVLETLKFRRRTARHADDDTAVAAADYLANLLRGIDTKGAKFVQTTDGPQIVTADREKSQTD